LSQTRLQRLGAVLLLAIGIAEEVREGGELRGVGAGLGEALQEAGHIEQRRRLRAHERAACQPVCGPSGIELPERHEAQVLLGRLPVREGAVRGCTPG